MVAVDLGASSARFAVGRVVGGRIVFEVVEQIPHRTLEREGRETWDLETLVGLCRRAWDYAATFGGSATLGIDSWGVDHGFIDPLTGHVTPPVAYRDRSHEAMFAAMVASRPRLYALTGIQHQPFNTIYQLAARAKEGRAPAPWLMMPDLMGYLLTGTLHCEATMASTTQLVDLGGNWCQEAFDLIGWPVPDLPISQPGHVLATVDHVSLVSVGSHDTASAVFGLGSLGPDQAFLNVGTWSLLGVLIDQPLLASERFTNERAVDGRVRYLTNIPGFYVANRVFEELGPGAGTSVADWLSTAHPGTSGETIDLTGPAFFNPPSMRAAISGAKPPMTPADWATRVLDAMVHTTRQELQNLESILGRRFTSLRVSGGGAKSPIFCQSLANALNIPLIVGPEEATLLGNFAVQLVASGVATSFAEASAIVDRSYDTQRFEPA